MGTKLSEKVALITGGGRGIGRAIALAYAREGAAVVVAARSEDEIAETVWLIEELGQRGHAIRTDVRNSDQVDDLVAQTLHIYGVPDILVNSAGVGFRAPLLETSAEHWDAIHDTLLRGTFLTTRSVVQHMQERKQGNIINIGAPIERLALPNFAAYCAAKYGVEGLTRALAKELRRSGINVNALHPGTHADTRMKQVLAPEANKGIVSPDSVSEAAVFLAQQPPRGTSGEIINTQTWSPPA